MSQSNESIASVYIGLGSNLAEPIKQIERALIALNKIPQTQLIQQSSLYKSEPMGPKDQNDYINSVVQLSTSLSPIDLLDNLQTIEKAHGRIQRSERWGPRTLDLDILLYANQIISSPRLTVPHYGMKDRMFVLLPLSEIAPTLKLPDNSLVSNLVGNLASQHSAQGIQKL